MTTISWKDIIESQHAELDEHGTPEDMYVDPAESTEDEVMTQFRIYEKNNTFQVVMSTDGTRFRNLLEPHCLDNYGSIVLNNTNYTITIAPKEKR